MYFNIIDALCNRFIGLSPFEVLNTPIEEVFDLYVDVVLHDYKNKNKQQDNNEEWVTSKNATWH